VASEWRASAVGLHCALSAKSMMIKFCPMLRTNVILFLTHRPQQVQLVRAQRRKQWRPLVAHGSRTQSWQWQRNGSFMRALWGPEWAH